MALAEALLAQEFNDGDTKIVDHHTYVFLGDGCLMEGISHRSLLARGHAQALELIAFYDDNGISIDGHVENWFADNTPMRFEAYGWNVIPHVDGHDIDAVDAAIKLAKTADRPTLICCKTIIGKGAPTKSNSHDAHGAPLGAQEIAATRAAIGWDYAPFVIPQDVYASWDATASGAQFERAWTERFAAYAAKHPARAIEFERRMKSELPRDFAEQAKAIVDAAVAKGETIATRKASQQTLDGLAAALPELLGGSADLTGSNLTNWKASKPVRAGHDGAIQWGNHVNWGVREFGMSAALNGIALHGGYLPFGGTFLTFSDYSRIALRMAALMKIRSIFVFTHDSIGLGEDGPTHQSIEHVSSLRLIPHLDVWRPADNRRDRRELDRGRAAHGPERGDLHAPESPVQRTQRPADRGGQEGRLCARRLGRGIRRPQADPDRHRLRGRTRGQGGRAAQAGGDRRARRVDAVDDGLRSPGRRLEGIRAAEGRRARRDRSRRDELLGQVRRPRGRRGRDRHVRRVGARGRAVQAFRFTVENVVATAKRILG